MTGRIRFLEGDGEWERTEGRTEAGGSNSNRTDKVLSLRVSGTWSDKLRDSPLWKWPCFCHTHLFPSQVSGAALSKSLSLAVVALAGWGRNVFQLSRVQRAQELWVARQSPVAVPEFPILFEFNDIVHVRYRMPYPVLVPL